MLERSAETLQRKEKKKNGRGGSRGATGKQPDFLSEIAERKTKPGKKKRGQVSRNKIRSFADS